MRCNAAAVPTPRLTRLATHLQPHRTRPQTATTHTMTTHTMSAPQPPPPQLRSAAPWRSLFLSHLETMDVTEFTLSTLRRASVPARRGGRRLSSSSSSFLAPPLYLPRARTCICRGLWASLPANPRNDAPLNPAGVWESEMLVFTTDVRMDKMEELWEDGIDLDLRTGRRGTDPGSPTTAKVGEELWEEGLARMRGKMSREVEAAEAVKSTKEQKLRGSGGGGPVEAIFWAREPAVQWRVRGRAYVLAPDIESSPEGREVITLLKSRMRRLPSSPSSSPPSSASPTDAHHQSHEKESEWSFAREITAHFGNLSPTMRGTFRNPPPGRPISLPVEGEGLALGQKVTDLEDPVARANFRVVVIVPDELDQADLSDPEHGRRWIHTYVGGAGHGKGQSEWESVEVWP
ncbi:pyridoxamine 5'-phosphate oxidase-domain-containing protein [Xylaria sp. FL1777]|nr:pyridoxamine 5'-phosphate oxidase-domain-containing protein [Xylaria sp. FL1777]